MIDSLRGELLEKAPGHCVVECGGVGYLVHVANSTFASLPEKGGLRLHIHYAVTVDVRSGQSEHRLFGFLNAAERHLFRQLIDVQGVSATIGLAIMGARPADDLRVAIMNGDETLLRSIKGIGPKLAQRIVAELRGKLTGEPVERMLVLAGEGNSLRAEALSALSTLGMDRAKAERAVQSVLKDRKNDPPPLEELIRLSLKNI